MRGKLLAPHMEWSPSVLLPLPIVSRVPIGGLGQRVLENFCVGFAERAYEAGW
jgi:hypothetical protein